MWEHIHKSRYSRLSTWYNISTHFVIVLGNAEEKKIGSWSPVKRTWLFVKSHARDCSWKVTHVPISNINEQNVFSVRNFTRIWNDTTVPHIAMRCHSIVMIIGFEVCMKSESFGGEIVHMCGGWRWRCWCWFVYIELNCNLSLNSCSPFYSPDSFGVYVTNNNFVCFCRFVHVICSLQLVLFFVQLSFFVHSHQANSFVVVFIYSIVVLYRCFCFFSDDVSNSKISLVSLLSAAAAAQSLLMIHWDWGRIVADVANVVDNMLSFVRIMIADDDKAL